jgi:MFS family permease
MLGAHPASRAVTIDTSTRSTIERGMETSRLPRRSGRGRGPPSDCSLRAANKFRRGGAPFARTALVTPETPATADRTVWWAAFGHRDFNAFQAARTLSILGMQMQSVAIGWQIYALTRRPLDLAWVGLAQFLPAVCFSLVGGHAADRFERRRIVMVCYGALAALSLMLFAIARAGPARAAPVYAVLAGVGVARAFQGPANQSIVPTLVPPAHFGNAVAWGSSFWQMAMVLGPTAGGVAYAALGGPSYVYAFAAACLALACVLVSTLRPPRPRPPGRPPESVSAASLLAGVRYVRSSPVLLGAMSLDLFGVLLGGATALLPVYARDILELGPWALGVLRSAPAVGAAVTAVALAVRPIERRAGVRMLSGVAVFGVATVVFGLSRSFPLSLGALIVVGAADMVSVFVRSSLVQLATPDAMRGRVSAVNMVFIGASNELGEFESGLTAQWFGTVPSVVLGGIGTLVVVALWAWRFPELRRVRRVSDAAAEPVDAAPLEAQVTAVED